MLDLRARIPGHALIEKLLAECDAGRIRVEHDAAVIDEESLGWYWGVFGERITAANLGYLGPDWTVLHSVPVGRSGKDIDHIAIGPPGVVVINSKDHRGKSIWAGGFGLKVNGQSRSGYIQGVLRDIALAEERLTRAVGFAVEVRGALSFIAPRSLKVTAQPGSPEHPITVASAEYLAPKLRSARPEYSAEQVGRIVEAASSPYTWLSHPERSRPGPALDQEFEALAAELGPMIDRRHQPPPAPAPSRAPARRPAARRRRSPLSRLLAGLIGLASAFLLFGLLVGVALPMYLAWLASLGRH